jgi:hypothetical protein
VRIAIAALLVLIGATLVADVVDLLRVTDDDGGRQAVALFEVGGLVLVTGSLVAIFRFRSLATAATAVLVLVGGIAWTALWFIPRWF